MTSKEEKQQRYIMRLGNEIIRLQDENNNFKEINERIINTNTELNYKLLEVMTMRQDCPYKVSRVNYHYCRLTNKYDNSLVAENDIFSFP